MSARALLASAFAALLFASASGAAFAQAKYPSRPLRVVVPYTPGGITDLTTRMVTQELAKNIGKIRALAMASEKRVAVAPDLPTIVESGVPVVGGTWVEKVEG